jgi:hypothetical protein
MSFFELDPISLPEKNEISKGTFASILKQAKLNEEEIQELLG